MPKLKPETQRPTAAEDQRINAGIAQDLDNQEWSNADFAKAKPAEEFFNAKTFAGLFDRKGRND